MSEVRLNFLNYNPDIEDTENQGLTIAQNVVHDTEGYRPVHLGSTGSFATSGGMASVTSVVCVPVGASEDVFCAWLSSNNLLQVGINGFTATTASTGYPLNVGTVGSNSHISFLGVTEYVDDVYFTVESWVTAAAPTSTLTSQTFSGYITRS